MEYKHVVVLITIDSQEAARKISDAVIEARKAACINIMSGVESHYRWAGKKEVSKELLLMVKTRAELLDDLVALVQQLHPYSIPEIIALPVIGGNDEYLRWVDGETE